MIRAFYRSAYERRQVSADLCLTVPISQAPRTINPPLTHESQPEDVNELLGYFLGEDAMRPQSYRRSIGQ
jgi:hypothetical protein